MPWPIGQKVALRRGAAEYLLRDAMMVKDITGAVLNLPHLGVVYTIRGSKVDRLRGGFAYLLDEVRNDPIGGAEPHFHETALEPVVDRRTEAEVEKLKKLQDPANHQEFEQPRVLEVAE